MKRLLIVDDHPGIRLMIHFALHQRFELDEAGSADAAYERICAARPDAMVLDVMMPGSMNGFELLERIRADPELASMHVVLITARATVADQELGRALGADAYFVKPFSSLALERHLADALLPADVAEAANLAVRP